ncbi:hypothetical protein PRIPAC_73977, partial [Pristionchus pacificus]
SLPPFVPVRSGPSPSSFPTSSSLHNTERPMSRTRSVAERMAEYGEKRLTVSSFIRAAMPPLVVQPVARPAPIIVMVPPSGRRRARCDDLEAAISHPPPPHPSSY